MKLRLVVLGVCVVAMLAAGASMFWAMLNIWTTTAYFVVAFWVVTPFAVAGAVWAGVGFLRLSMAQLARGRSVGRVEADGQRRA